ncbi:MULTISPECIES: LytR family transcriptional regulator [Metabacillus]|uniref:Polyisoprenyl-teichoic acid--peptidoglycan teichoic acid transferase TagU n=2 Tax=Metabacillus TaxID=2675233 RepID=A0A179SLY6_9BACI|nr:MULTISPECIES: LytR family transcriptional regulator [Metabacillus]OAS82471.1 trascriptional regulator [Metabacillus litoralis]QNF26655.1 LytR family transcriptional regulator [Metabacillus sp. KUDC1714]
MEEKENQDKRKKSKKRTFNIVISISLLLIIGVGIYGFSVYRSVANTLNRTHEPLKHEVSKNRNAKINFSKQDPISILLLGVDERDNDRGRSDSLILLTINPKDQSANMVSIPRDTRTEIAGQEKEDKINHAYSFGGIDATIETVENFIDIPVDFYIEVNMKSFEGIVDAVGGITVNNTLDFTYEGTHFSKGELQLNGEEALKYSRMRNEDPRGDFGRQDRQRQTIQAIINKGARVKTLANYSDVLEVIGENLRTNLTFNDMKDIQANYKEARHNIQQIQINGNGKEINGVYYYIVPQSERTELSTMLKQHLNVN